MTNNTPHATVIPPSSDVTVTWHRTVVPSNSITTQRQGRCEQCDSTSMWTALNEPLLCRLHRDLAAYAALPWWRRAFTRKPKP